MTTHPFADALELPVSAADARPDFIVRLGLLLPCSEDDVKAAYRDRAKQAHPDAGGSTSAFTQLQSDYEAALEYAQYHASRRGWLAANVERYVAQQELIAQIEQLGGAVETQRTGWIAREIGEDFAHLLDTIVAIRLTGPKIGLEEVQFLASRREELAQLHQLDLSDSRVDHRAVQCLAAFPTLHELDLSGTFAGNRAAVMLARLPALRRVNVADTFVSWLARLALRRLRGMEIIARRGGTTDASTTKRGYRWLLRALIVYVVALVVATHIPQEPEIVRRAKFADVDKLVHFGIYGGLTWLLAFLLSLRSLDSRAPAGLSVVRYAAIAIFVATFAALDEFTQPWTGRDGNLYDWLADVIGMAAGIALFTVFERYRRSRRELAAGAQTFV